MKLLAGPQYVESNDMGALNTAAIVTGPPNSAPSNRVGLSKRALAKVTSAANCASPKSTGPRKPTSVKRMAAPKYDGYWFLCQGLKSAEEANTAASKLAEVKKRTLRKSASRRNNA